MRSLRTSAQGANSRMPDPSAASRILLVGIV